MHATPRDDAAAHKARTQALFNGLARGYDEAGPGIFAHFGRRLVDLLEVEPGQRVLDVATGRGAVLFPAAERAGAMGEVVGIDIAEGMVTATRADAARRGVPVQVQVMDAEALAFPDASFDRVCCGFGVMFFPDLGRALRECRRVLKPGGRLGVSTWQISQSEDLAAVLTSLALPEGKPPGWIAEPERLEAALGAAGFVEVQVTVDSASFPYADLDAYWENAQGTGRREALERLSAAQRDQVRAALAERLRPYERADGLYVPATALLATARR
jgi:ubiquinone/menaquinone biosynthesis C-methylase UbiE